MLPLRSQQISQSTQSSSIPSPSNFCTQKSSTRQKCQDGLGEDHVFWPIFRSALNLEGVLGQTTLELAVRRMVNVPKATCYSSGFLEFQKSRHAVQEKNKHTKHILFV